jgi:L-cysteate sulfo-lyase
MSMYSVSDIQKAVQGFPRKNIVPLPTPFQKMDNLSQSLGGPEIYIKRDDLTGLAFGGNKSRKLDFILPDVLRKKADVVITWGALQSNWCLQTAAAARKFGITPVLILFKELGSSEQYDGNLLLDYILEADIKVRELGKQGVIQEEDIEEILEEAVMEVKEWGHSPYVIPLGGSKVGGSMEKPLGAISYVGAFVELHSQASAQGLEMDYVLHASGSGGTQAGLAVGASALGDKTRVLGISVSEEKMVLAEDVHGIAKHTLKALNIDVIVSVQDIVVLDEYVGKGYGVVDKEVSEVIRFVAKKEGIFLDPIYTGKAMVALFDLVKKGDLKKGDKVVFYHTGGSPTLFPHKSEISKFLSS